jgi:hypothetical protein
MALIRCEVCGAPTGRTHTYQTRPFEPEGHPHSGLVCGSDRCRTPGLVYLTLDEARRYANGERIFELPNTQAAKVKVADPKT